MIKRAWIAISSILAFVLLLIPSARSRDLTPAAKWVARFNGPGNDFDRANAIAVDGSGNVCVTGECSSSGLWHDYATIKYNTNGKQLWVKMYDGPGHSDDGATAIAVDGSGNVYVTGWSLGSGDNSDYATIKYDTNGKQLWIKRYDGPGHRSDSASAIVVDGSGNVYVTGASDGAGTYSDYATIKYNTNGKQLWVKRYTGPGNSFDGANAIAVDSSGNVYVTGCSFGSDNWNDYATIKYNTNGKQLWAKRYNEPDETSDVATALAVDGSGNVYVTGCSTSGTGGDYTTIKYNPNGEQLWIKRYNGPGNDYDLATAIAVDSSGNIYVTGESGIWVSGPNYDYATIKYSPNGKQLWVKRYNGPGKPGYADDRAKAIAVDGLGNVFVTGYSRGSGTDYDYATIKY